MKKLTLTLIIILTLTLPANAITGYISLEYVTINQTGTGEVFAEQYITDKLSIGGRMTTDLMGFGLKDGYFPAGVPKAQSYDLIIKYDLTDDIELSLIEGCNHNFSQSGIPAYKDNSYIKIKAKYKF